MQRLREAALAAFVVFHLAAVVLGALPSPRGLTSPKNLADPGAVRFMESLRQGVRYEGDAQAFQDDVVRRLDAALAARTVLLAPFQPYYRVSGSRQSWRMFAFLNRTPGALVIRVDDQEIYRSGRGGWQEDFWEGSRMAGLVGTWSHTGRKPRSFKRLTTTLVPALAADFPDAEHATFCIEHQRVAQPGATRPEPTCQAPLRFDLR
jgi:hypothetical protein